jgi:integrase/recombinase XerC
VTAALDAGLDVRQVWRFSHHARLDTLLVYDDNRKDLAGEVARRVAAAAIEAAGQY